ncbi:MAG: glycosyltransferase family 2 protein [Rhabdochlamydiaceae bacterium]|nr:glycosyltransferase family 2 protein [Candidatus Amphrikana amoebophyrae]
MSFLKSIILLCFASSMNCFCVHFTIVIPSYNNADIASWNLKNVLSQRYDDYNVIYLNDCSTDDTASVVSNIIKHHPQGRRVKLINNPVNVGALANIYNAVHNHIKDENSVVVLLDGDDALSHKNVLARLNKYYSQEDIWLTYGQFLMKNSCTRGWAAQIPYDLAISGNTRSFPHVPTHLRTFKTWLFRRIKVSDLKHQGEFYPMAWDLAIMLPMVEMAANHHYKFIGEVLYIYNDGNPLSDHIKDKSYQRKLDLQIRSKPRYSPLKCK